MSIFAKPISQLTWTDLEELLTGQAVENIRLEFKRDVPDRDETLKKLSSFANTFGGQVIVGAEADSKEGRLLSLPGVIPQKNYKQTVVQWCVDGVTPFLDVDVSDAIPHPSGSRQVCYVVRIRESDLAPHFLNGRRGIYVRTNEFSARFEARLANEAELRHLFDRRKTIVDRRAALIQRARQRFATFVNRKYSELTKKEKIGSRFDLVIVPRFPSQEVCDQASLNSLVQSERVPWRQVGFPRLSVGFISQHESGIVLRPGSSFSILEANVWGLLFYATEIERNTEKIASIHLNHFLGQLLVFLEHARALISKFGYVGPLVIEMRMDSICGVPWIYFEHGSLVQGPSSELDDEVTFWLDTSTEELQDARDKLAAALLRYVFFALNWPDAASSKDKLEGLLRLAYEYNMWQWPTV
jgi:hypothetical protein